MVTPHTARRANRTVAGVLAIVLVMLAGVTLAALALRGGRKSTDHASNREAVPAGEETAVDSKVATATPDVSVAIASVTPPLVSATSAPAVSVSTPAVTKPKPPTTKPSPLSLCRANPRRCR